MLTLYREFGDAEGPVSAIRARLRERRLRLFMDMVDAIHRERGCCRIIDVGGRKDYWQATPVDFLTSRCVTIHISNLEPQPEAVAQDPIFSWRREDGTTLDYADGEFDLVHSNSVIEHVGRWSDMEAFAERVRRIGRGYFVQTPSYWFPFEPHFGTLFFAQLPRPMQAKLLMKKGRGFYPKVDTMAHAMRALETVQLLTRPMLAALFPDARIEAERIAGLHKSLIAVRDAA
jgi:hypothetical protein